MPEFKEKPKMGQPKSKRSAMLDPRHRAVLLKEKYRQQVEQQDTDTENAETQAVGRVESRCGMGSRGAAGAKKPQAPKKKAAGQGKTFDLR